MNDAYNIRRAKLDAIVEENKVAYMLNYHPWFRVELIVITAIKYIYYTTILYPVLLNHILLTFREYCQQQLQQL